MDKKTFITKSKKETQDLGKDLAKSLNPGDVLVFFGYLGSGKTTFIQGVALGLGITKRIISPTFIIVRQHKINNLNFYHIDLYRTTSKHDLLGVGLDQIIEDKDGIVAIEWGEKLGELMPRKRIEISLKAINENEREVKIERYE